MDLLSICTRELVTLDGGAPQQQAARLMREHHVGSVVVTQAADGALRAVGIVTDRDLVVESMARGADAARETVSSLIEGRVLQRAIHGAFDAVDRRLEDHARRRRHQTKAHSKPNVR